MCHTRFLEKIRLQARALDACRRVEVQRDELSESRRVVVAHLGIAGSVRIRVRLEVRVGVRVRVQN